MKKARDGKLPLSKLITNQGTKKYVQVDEKKTTARVDETKIERDALWDGLHGIVTNISDEKVERLLSHYRGLWQIEAAFRVTKHDLRIRPIFHWTKVRIEAHIAICFLSYALTQHAQYRLKVQSEPLSVERLRNELMSVRSDIVEDISTGNMWVLPLGLQATQKKIYQVFGLKRKEAPYQIVGSR